VSDFQQVASYETERSIACLRAITNSDANKETGTTYDLQSFQEAVPQKGSSK